MTSQITYIPKRRYTMKQSNYSIVEGEAIHCEEEEQQQNVDKNEI